MAVFCLTSAFLDLGNTDYSDHIKSVTLALDAAQLDTTDMASGGWTESIGGLKAGTITVQFIDDFADDNVDEDLWALFGTEISFQIAANAPPITTSNPKYTGAVLISDYKLGGQVGELMLKDVTWQTTGTVQRATS